MIDQAQGRCRAGSAEQVIEQRETGAESLGLGQDEHDARHVLRRQAMKRELRHPVRQRLADLAEHIWPERPRCGIDTGQVADFYFWRRAKQHIFLHLHQNHKMVIFCP